MSDNQTTKPPRLEALKRMRIESMNRYELASANANRAQGRLSAAFEELDVLHEIIRTMEGDGGSMQKR